MAMEKGKRSCLAGVIIFVTAGFAILLILVFGFFALVGSSISAVSGPRIALIELDGIITSVSDYGFGGTGKSMVERIKDELGLAVDDPEVKAIVLRINSPGGEVTASDTIYHAVQKANEKKPVIVYMDSVAASGGYYVACGAEEIYANETTMTGSIGVIIQTLNYEELMGKVGLKSVTFTSGEFKDMLSSSRPMRPEEEKLVQEMVMEIYEKFISIVAESRGLPAENLRDGIADGRVLSGAGAVKAGLVDKTGYVEDAYDRARELAKAPEAEVVPMRQPVGFFEAFGLAQAPNVRAGVPGRLEIDVSDRLLPRLRPGVMYLLPHTFGQ